MRLTSLERNKIIDDYNSTSAEIARLEQILADERLLLALVKKELIGSKRQVWR